MHGYGSKGYNDIQLWKWFSRNTLVSILSGILFAIGWWLIIDTTIQYPRSSDFNKIYLLIGVVSTVALILTNSVSNARVQSNAQSDSCLSQFGARLFLLFSFILAFGSLIASAWLLFGYYIPSRKEKFYPGVAIFLQNLAIAISTFIFKLARKDDHRYY